MRRLVLVVCLAACRWHFADVSGDASGGGGDSVSPPAFVPEWKSGTRYRARLLVSSEGGDPIFEGWRDTMLDTDCQSQLSADGVERCLPVHLRADTFFADAGCTQPLAVSFASQCWKDRYATRGDLQNREHIYALGPIFGGAVYDGRNGCTLYIPPPNATVYQVAPTETPPATFAETVYTMQTVGLHTHIYATWGDGSSFDLSALSGADGSCYPIGGRLGPSQCRPNGLDAGTPVYADAACTQRAYLVGAAGVTQLIVDEHALCGAPFRIYQTTGDVTGGTYWRRTLGGCTAQSTPSGSHLYTATEIADGNPTGKLVPGARHGRLGRLYWVGDDDGVALPIENWDHVLGRPCVEFIASDGQLRCLPRQPQLLDAHETATCTDATKQLAGTCYGSEPLDGPFYPSCEDQPGEVRTMPVAPMATIDEDGTCHALDGLGPAHEHGTGSTVLPPAMFAPLTQVIE